MVKAIKPHPVINNASQLSNSYEATTYCGKGTTGTMVVTSYHILVVVFWFCFYIFLSPSTIYTSPKTTETIQQDRKKEME